MPVQNKAMLITYADSMGRNIKELQEVLTTYIGDAIGGIHLLPFCPSTGDRGFAPSDYTRVDSAFGDWRDVQALGKKYYLMFDFMINHISRESVMYQDFKAKKDASVYRDFFIRWEKFWPQGRPTQADIDLIYKRKDRAPIQEITFADGSQEHLWNTFGDEQIDINVNADSAKKFIKETLLEMVHHGADLIRLDAFAYAIKKIDTNDFFVEPEIWQLLDSVRDILTPLQAEILPEIHEHYTIPAKINAHGYFTYDFVLPLVTLYTLYSGKTAQLAKWLKMSPKRQFTTLDTHDGIGVVDARDILTDDEITYTSSELYKVGANVKKTYSSAAYNNLDIYQINSTYYSSLGNDDKAYLLARIFQIFAPGIPQIYYVGLLAGANDLDLLERTKEGRNINRHYYSQDEVAKEVQRPVVKKLLELLSWRNQFAAFDLDGEITVQTEGEQTIRVKRTSTDGRDTAILQANAADKTFTIKANDQIIFSDDEADKVRL
ncbi:MAG: sucrose phosphorylase [Oenococcus sp.]|uniref:sucrose phosphorylase n=1 Tax=Oenococcus TaxID=46254 RepID=UPI0021E73493|nr:sucrose phosphorylase [Oenococcus kitaharae]MCV3297162.1 sucrose phosphorylase [Oenococcus kitaharae]